MRKKRKVPFSTQQRTRKKRRSIRNHSAYPRRKMLISRACRAKSAIKRVKRDYRRRTRVLDPPEDGNKRDAGEGEWKDRSVQEKLTPRLSLLATIKDSPAILLLVIGIHILFAGPLHIRVLNSREDTLLPPRPLKYIMPDSWKLFN